MLRTITVDDLHDIVEALSAALDAKNSCMCGHSERVAEISLLLAQAMNLPPPEQTRIHIGAHLHDVGKIGIPDAVLNKPGKLTEAEYALIRKHPEIGASIVSKVKVFQPIVDIVRSHHERYDGDGYPDRLRGEAISLGARIVAVADAFDAMTSARTYRSALRVSQAAEEMRRCSGSQFDPEVVAVLLSVLQQDHFPVSQSMAHG